VEKMLTSGIPPAQARGHYKNSQLKFTIILRGPVAKANASNASPLGWAVAQAQPSPGNRSPKPDGRDQYLTDRHAKQAFLAGLI
jgi:hypothetical protein